MITLWLFVFGAAIGSFLNVVALRYDPDLVLFSAKKIGGRSYCPHCRKTLRWFELIPILSFLVQGAHCRRCRARISFRYPIVEVLSGLIFALVPFRCMANGAWFLNGCLANGSWHMDAIWVLVFESLLLMSLVDIEHFIIPDEINIFLIVLGICGILLSGYQALQLSSSVYGLVFASGFFGLIILVTRGRGMGLGDLKLAAPLGLLFGWPNIIVLTISSFVIGSLFGAYALAFGGKTMKSAVPFGPFLAIGAAVAFFAGPEIIRLYLSML